MNIIDELERLDKLHKDGALSNKEFAKANRPAFSISIIFPRPQRTNEKSDRT